MKKDIDKSQKIIENVKTDLNFASLHLMNARNKLLNAVLEDFDLMRKGQKLYDKNWKHGGK